MPNGLRTAAALLCWLALATSTVAAPKVAVSIKPVHALVAGVMDGSGTPDLVIPGSASPHAYALRPSEARLLANADLVFWVGPTLEVVLSSPITALAGKARVVRLIDEPGLRQWPIRTGREWPAHNDYHGHGHDHHHGHAQPKNGGGIDPHIWLDPHNAKLITRTAARVLAEIDPVNAARYRANSERQLAALDALTGRIGGILEPVKNRPFLVFHDAYQYFERRFALSAAGAIAISPDRQPGPRQISRLRKVIRAKSVRCLFMEPQFPPRIAAVVAAGTGIRTDTLDPLGAALTAGPGLYATLLENMAGTLSDCLSQKAGVSRR
ncbi:MAG: zinc transporter substrate-binding protein [Pseudomonadota bacterium]|jgi:zinc transport system substrate-binding protein